MRRAIPGVKRIFRTLTDGGTLAHSIPSCLGTVMGKPKSDVLQGTLDLLILKTLEGGPMHGYGIASRIEEVSEELLRVEEGSLYPALHRIQQTGWIRAQWKKSESGRPAKYYTPHRGRTEAVGVRRGTLEETHARRLQNPALRL